ncbi:hypothetical protein PISMIDRAFT_677426 [Pisolithus microcarpus 441]|uniref:Uncharacterized protein n=1 Tax=Pisolithus microcarpus 441 TaxID=765257 RepID=A0A0C9YJP8_9AGAM|nr:hypothetical protein BKA83DRAFT_677426 [Pisolithus microcarpus]KIK25180.1 hypothetical protein PISMIDRAFT_677426 [Pisolithus microcarpus 441]
MNVMAALAVGTLIFSGQAFGSPLDEIISSPSLLVPTAIPGTTAFPSSLPFDTTASSSFLSALSSYISSESAAATSPLSPPPTPALNSTMAMAPSVSVAAPTTPTSVPTSTSTSGIPSSGTAGVAAGRNLDDMSLITSVVLGMVVVLL